MTKNLDGLQDLKTVMAEMRIANPTTSNDELLANPMQFTIVGSYIRPNSRHLVADHGDTVIVFALTDDSILALAFNPCKKSARQIPEVYLDRDLARPADRFPVVQFL